MVYQCRLYLMDQLLEEALPGDAPGELVEQRQPEVRREREPKGMPTVFGVPLMALSKPSRAPSSSPRERSTTSAPLAAPPALAEELLEGEKGLAS